RVASALGLLVLKPGASKPTLRAGTFVLGPDLRVRAVVPIGYPARHVAEVPAAVEAQAPPEASPGDSGAATCAAVPALDRVLEPELCEALIRYYDGFGEAPLTGVLAHGADGRGEVVVDAARKVRRDVVLDDPKLRDAVHDRLKRRVVPEVRKVFQVRVTHAERYVVACYEARDEGWFAAHRDNQGLSTVHRRFACTINLNAEDYEGGDLSFPEFGARRYRATTGGCIVFGC